MLTKDITEKLVHEFIEPLWDKRDFSVIDKFIAQDAEIRTTFITGKGPEVLKKSIEDTFSAFPVFKLKLEEIIQQTTQVTFKWSAFAEHQGAILNIKPSGKTMFFNGIVFGEIENDMIIQYHSFSNIPQTLYENLEHTTSATFPPEAVLLDHENYESEISELIFSIVKATSVRLTRREVECLYFWLRGYSIKETAIQLGNISVKTIQVFRDNIRKKFDLSSYRALVDMLQKKGIFSLFFNS